MQDIGTRHDLWSIENVQTYAEPPLRGTGILCNVDLDEENNSRELVSNIVRSQM